MSTFKPYCFWGSLPNHFVLNVQIPVNTTATIYLPFQQKNTILQNGKMVTTFQKNLQQQRAVIKVASGKYQFVVQ